MGKTPNYIKKAIDTYRKKYDFVQLRLPAGTRERMAAAGVSASDFIDVVLQELERRESVQKSP